ncbi:MAG: ferritin-like domain-containing protein [Candidatus Micrarchaeota archaeon]
MSKAKLIELLNKGLQLEHQAAAQYLSHATLTSGECADSLTERLKEIAKDEEEHAEKFRACLEILDAAPDIKMAPGHPAKDNTSILKVNLKDEKDAVDFYREIWAELKATRDELPYEYEYIEHKLRHIIMDEQEHALELRTLLGQ